MVSLLLVAAVSRSRVLLDSKRVVERGVEEGEGEWEGEGNEYGLPDGLVPTEIFNKTRSS